MCIQADVVRRAAFIPEKRQTTADRAFRKSERLRMERHRLMELVVDVITRLHELGRMSVNLIESYSEFYTNFRENNGKILF